MHGDAAIAPWDVPAVSGTGLCATGGLDMAMVVLSQDSYDLIHTTDHAFEWLPLDGASMMHPEDISVLLDMKGYPDCTVCCCWLAGRNFADLSLGFGFA